MSRFSRRWFLHRLAAAGVVSWVSLDALAACRPQEVPSSASPSRTTRMLAMATPTPGVQVGAKDFPLPPPRIQGTLSLEEALARRRSIRAYTNEPLRLEDIGQLFWSAQGVTRSWGGRTAPSAGALYPLEIYAAAAEVVYHYLPAGHRAEVVLRGDVRRALWVAGLQQQSLREAAVIFILTAIHERTAQRYGARAERYVKLEAGHAAENLLLQAVALNLAAVVIGAFDDAAVASALHLPAEEEPLYLIPVGHAAE